MTSEQEPVFKVPIAYLDDKKELKQEIDNDLELTSGENPFYETLFNANNKFRKLTALHDCVRSRHACVFVYDAVCMHACVVSLFGLDACYTPQKHAGSS